MDQDSNIIYKEKNPEKSEYFLLFDTTGWNQKYKLNEDQLFQAISNSWYMISAYDNNRLIGYGRIISDGIQHALILDLIVIPDFQHRGIGRTILSKLVNRCLQSKICDIQLFSAKGNIPFYQLNGFIERPVDAPGMEYSHSS
jgi:ribosomal protein S18 acetylase RimI-like enzyme